jgi:hypothetical protein
MEISSACGGGVLGRFTNRPYWIPVFVGMAKRFDPIIHGTGHLGLASRKPCKSPLAPLYERGVGGNLKHFTSLFRSAISAVRNNGNDI